MAERRKYEEAGGVVPLTWRDSSPSSNEQFGFVVAEVWDASWHFGDWSIAVRASMRVLSWGKDEKGECCWIDVQNTRRLADGYRFRRWFRPQTTYMHFNPTLRDWSI